MAHLKEKKMAAYDAFKEVQEIQTREDIVYDLAFEYSKLGNSPVERQIKRRLNGEIDNNLRTMEYETTRMLNLTKPVFTFVREN